MPNRNVIGIMLVITFASVALRQYALTTVCALALLPLLVAYGWRRWALRAVVFERTLDAGRIFPGDAVAMTTKITNRKLLPLTRLDVSDTIPDGIDVMGEELMSAGRLGRKTFIRSLRLGWYEALSRRYELRCAARGLYRFGPVRLRSGDPFGFGQVEAEHAVESRLLVYPRLLPPSELGFEMRQLLGTIRSQQRLVVDPARTIGVRDYHRDDPLKSIHWNATARRGELQTRLYEPVTALQIMCFLDISTFEKTYQGIQRDQAERLISMAATVCKELTDARHAVGLWSNAASAEGGTAVRLPPSRNPQQAGRILATLAQLTLYAGPTISHTIALAQASLSNTTTIVLISAISTAEIRATLARLRGAGYAVLWIALSQVKPAVPKIVVFHAPTEGM